MSNHRSNKHLRVQLKALVEHSNYYCRAYTTLMRKLALSHLKLYSLVESMGYTVFVHEGTSYVGCQKQKDHYYHDKLLGQNPFYQTS